MKQMNKNEFMEYVQENFQVDGAAQRLISNILDYVEFEGVSENEQYRILNSLLNSTIGLSEQEIRSVYL